MIMHCNICSALAVQQYMCNQLTTGQTDTQNVTEHIWNICITTITSCHCQGNDLLCTI